MPPPFYQFQLGTPIKIKTAIRGLTSPTENASEVNLPPGTYIIESYTRLEEYQHVWEMSDGYLYRIEGKIQGKIFGAWVWQNDLILGEEGEMDDYEF